MDNTELKVRLKAPNTVWVRHDQYMQSEPNGYVRDSAPFEAADVIELLEARLRQVETTLSPTEKPSLTFDQWKEDYGLVHEPNYSKLTEIDCEAAFTAGSEEYRTNVLNSISGVFGTVYLLVEPTGRLIASEIIFDNIVEGDPNKCRFMSTAMKIALSNVTHPEMRACIYVQYGWKILVCTFTPNLKIKPYPTYSE